MVLLAQDEKDYRFHLTDFRSSRSSTDSQIFNPQQVDEKIDDTLWPPAPEPLRERDSTAEDNSQGKKSVI